MLHVTRLIIAWREFSFLDIMGNMGSIKQRQKPWGVVLWCWRVFNAEATAAEAAAARSCKT